MKSGPRQRGALALAVSACSGLVLAQVALHPAAGQLAPFAIVPVIAVWLRSAPRLALVSGLCFGTAFFLTLFGWAITAGPQSPSVAAATIAAVVESGYVAVTGFVVAWMRAASALGSAVLVASLWTLSEYARELGMWGLPYGEIGATQSQTGFAPLAALLGTIGIGFVLVFAAGLIAHALAAQIEGRTRSLATPALAAVALLAIVDGTTALAPQPRAALISGRGALVVQSPAIGQADVARFAHELPALVARTVPSSPVDLVALPEATLRFVPARADDRAIQAAARAVGVPIVVGSLADHDGNLYNAARFYQPHATTIDEYDKRQLVPFGEFLPLPAVLGLVTSRKNAGFASGERAPRLHGTRADIAVLICFEASFARLTREAARKGAAYTLVLVNDDWFANSEGLDLQYAVMALRARESGVDLIVAGNRGPSGIFHHDGSSSFFQAGIPMLAPVRPSRAEATVYRTTGDGPLLFSCVIAIGFMLMQRLRRLVS